MALGLRRDDAPGLRTVLLEAAETAEAEHIAVDAWVDQWRLDIAVTRHGRHAMVGTVGVMRTGERSPRFVTGWVLV